MKLATAPRSGLAIAFALTGFLAACGGGDDDSTAAATTASLPADQPAAAADVDIADFSFMPAEIHVAVGGTVSWTNHDDQQHTATSSGAFDAGAIQPDASATVTFDEAGTFAFICSFHPFMNGTVVVG